MENRNGEKLISFNFERIKYWMAKKARLSNPVAELLGIYAPNIGLFNKFYDLFTMKNARKNVLYYLKKNLCFIFYYKSKNYVPKTLKL